MEWIFPGNSRTRKSAAKKEGRKEKGNRKWMALSLSLVARCFLISEGGRQPKQLERVSSWTGGNK